MKLSFLIAFAAGAGRIPVLTPLRLGLRRAWAVLKTRTAISGLSEAQLRDIGLTPGGSLQEPDEHQRYWRDRLAPWIGRRF